jgi:hypothetical protein
MSGADVAQGPMTIEAFGEVLPPPDLSAVLEKIRTAAQFKQWLELSPAELRVLVNLLDDV